MDFAAISLKGPKDGNEDRTLPPLTFQDGWVAAIADGVGGNAGGHLAAELAIHTIASGVEKGELTLDTLFEEISQRISTYVSEYPLFNRMATTLSVVRVAGDGMAEVAHAGDTRVYHIRGSGIVTRTRDQTEVAELIDQNILSPSQAKRYPRRNVLTSYLSANGRHQVYRTSFRVEPHDWILLLSDGAYGKLRKSELVEISGACRTANDFAAKIEERLGLITLDDDSSMVAVLA